MKKIISAAFLFLIFVGLSICFPPKALAINSTVDYGNAEGFIFNPEDGDLFGNFKGLMPGDEKTQRIAVINTCVDRDVSIYLRAEIGDEYKDFLNNIEITVKQTKNGSVKTLVHGSAADEGDLKEPVLLGKYKPNEKSEISVEIFIDPETGNDFADRTGIIRWIFSAEEDEPYITEEQHNSIQNSINGNGNGFNGNGSIRDRNRNGQNSNKNTPNNPVNPSDKSGNRNGEKIENSKPPFTGSDIKVTVIFGGAILMGLIGIFWATRKSNRKQQENCDFSEFFAGNL